MKIIFTGGGSGGHFYPIIAVAEAVNDIVKERNLIAPELYYIADTPYDERLLYENDIIFKRTPAGKVRRYFSFRNVSDFIKTMAGVPSALFQLFGIFPDVVFSKGSYVSVPTVTAARILGIPVIIHESDAVPGRANLYAAKFAKRIAVAFPQAADLFPHKDRVAFVGQPVRKAVKTLVTEGRP
jgi:UDP-N-acetylglucosamine--N-acetylmuramyl-(pentapeptide) pyrophosphoryl-undecaprenol N-acetylglucosamine transferase